MNYVHYGGVFCAKWRKKNCAVAQAIAFLVRSHVTGTPKSAHAHYISIVIVNIITAVLLYYYIGACIVTDI